MSNPALPTWLTDSLRQSTKATQEPSSPSFPRTALSLGHDAILGWSDQEFIGAHGHVTVKKVALRIHPAISGALVGLLISFPDAFAMKSYAGILGTGLIFGALAGWAAKTRGS